MKQLALWMLVALWAVPAVALAQLPPLNEEESAKKADAAARKTASDDAAKAALGQAQDRVAKRYYQKNPGAPRPVPVVVAPAPAATRAPSR